MKTIKRCVYLLLAFALALGIVASGTTPANASPSKNYTLTGNGADDIVAVALAQKGKTRSDFGYTVDWCAYFTCWAGRTAGADFPSSDLGTPYDVARWFVNNNKGKFYCFRDGNYNSLVESGINYQSNIIRTSREKFTPQKGDLICYLWAADEGKYNWSHIGIVTEDYTGNNLVSTVEGNTGSRPGVVDEFYRHYDSTVVGIIRPNYRKAHTHNYTGARVYESAHPHRISQRCVDYATCGGWIWTDEYREVKTCEQCWHADFNIDASSISVKVGESKTVTVKVSGCLPDSVKAYQSFSPNNDVVKLTTKSYQVTFTGLKEGTTNYCINVYSDSSKSHVIGTKTIPVTVTAQTYTVSYNANGGSGAPGNQIKTHGTALTLSNTQPTRPGYIFLGWSTSSTATSATYQSGSRFTSNADTTLYAVWQANKYTVSYNANGGSGAPANQTKTHGKTLTLSSTKPTRPGYTFLGWSTSSIATSATYKSGGSFTTNETTTLYAVWKPAQYTITYNANGGSGAPANQTKTHGKTLTLSSTKPTRSGYTFLGWSTSSTATSATYQSGGSFTSNANTTLYAVWKQNPAANTPRITVENQTVIKGQTITVEIIAANMPNVKSLMIENFRYDGNMLEFVSAELNLENAFIADWDSTDMIATVAFTENTNINGVIMTMTFKVKEDVESECSIKCDVYANQIQAGGNETQIELSVVPGTITVVSYERGDVNGDGYVNSNDAIYLLRYTLLSNRYPINQSGDMNGDGYVNSNDAIYLLRHTLSPSRYPLN